MNVQKRNIVVLSLVLVFSVAALSLIGVTKVSSETVTNNVCANGATLLINGTVNTSIALDSNQIPLLSVHTATSDAPLVSKVVFYLNETIPIGKAVKDGTYQWNMPWVVGLAPLDSNQIARVTAKVFYTDSASGTATSCIVTQPVYATVSGARATTMTVAVTPSQWAGPMSYSLGINTMTQVQQPAFDPTQFAIYEWDTTIGALIPPLAKNAQLSSGTTAGSGVVTVRVMYGGASKELVIPITVKSPDAPLPAPDSTTTTTNNTTTNSTTTTTNKTTTPTTVAIQPTPTVQNPTAQDCVVSAIGEERFKAINSGTSRPTPEEIIKFKVCFASSNYIVPSNFAPVAPTEIKKLNVAKAVELKNPENEKRVVDNVEKNVLKFSGKAEPNSIVFLYVFSDPLVLTTKTDGDGNWEYVLEDPIEPGNHEVYSVVNRGDGVYQRSEVVSFQLSETAEAATVNPNGLTLKLANATPPESQRSLGLYIAGSITVLAFAIGGFLITLTRRNRSAKRDTFSAFPAAGTTSAVPIQAQPEQQSVAPTVIPEQIIGEQAQTSNSVGERTDDSNN